MNAQILLRMRLIWVALGGLTIALGLIVATVWLPRSVGDRPWLGLDVNRLFEAANVWRGGGDPYGVYGYLYPPLTTSLSAVFVPLGQSVFVGLYRVLEGVALVTGVIYVAQGWRPIERAFALVAITLSLCILADLIVGNLTVFFLLAMLPIIERDRARAGVPLGLLLALAPKPFAILFLAWMAVHRRNSALGAITAAAIATMIGLVLSGPDSYVRWLGVLSAGGGINYDFAGNLGLTRSSALAAALLGAISLLGFVLVLWRGSSIAALGWAFGCGVLVTPYIGLYAGAPFLLLLPRLAPIAPVRAIGVAFATILFVFTAPLATVAVLVISGSVRSRRSIPMDQVFKLDRVRRYAGDRGDRV